MLLVLGAGFSVAAGIPLTYQLLQSPIRFANSQQAFRQMHRVSDDYSRWKEAAENPSPEIFLRECFLRTVETPFDWAVRSIAAEIETGHSPNSTLQHRYRHRISTPLRDSRYDAFWQIVQSSCTAIVSLNYDLVVERSLRHRPMKRPRLRGCRYGGLELPVSLRGSVAATRHRDYGLHQRMNGEIPLFKLHGSLNWAIHDGKIVPYVDTRPAYRDRSSCAIVPPLPEKTAPEWLTRVWEACKATCSDESTWIICGCSLPEYDHAARRLFGSLGKSARTALLLDPAAKMTRSRWEACLPSAKVETGAGFPDCLHRLEAFCADYR